ncbi:capsid assembly protein [Roseococcus thiosulfatophilus]|uniref:capsid assembly protein n=1 Tax=Roseococcus thiosulfatophilus TaxID=35813 RepID=UPI001A8E8D29|nr:hypothetical protein [Roseococcus thiosulfatophilus]
MSETQTAPADTGAPAEGAPPPEAAAPPATPGSIFDAAGEPPPPTEDGKPGRPDYIPENFWDAEKGEPRIEQMARTVAELRLKISRGAQNVPKAADDYKLPAIEGLPAEAVKPDDPLWSDVRKAAHENGLSQAQLEALAKPYLARLAEAMQQQQATASPEVIQQRYAEEIKRLGPEGPAVLRDVKSWMGGLEQRGILSREEAQALYGVTNADGVRALAKLRQLTGEKPIPVTALEDGKGSLEDAKRMMTEGYKTNDMAMVKRGEARIAELEKQGVL